MTLRIVADENIPAVTDYFSRLGEIECVDGRQLQRQQLQNADLLLVRSVTQVNEALLRDTPVRFVASSTIGTDHLDTDYLQAQGIGWANAPGSNANSVVEYVLSACCRIEGLLERLFDAGRVGIVGMGNVGSRLYQRLSALGIDCVGYDPLIEAGRYPVLGSLSEVLATDLICLHTPLTKGGAHPTYHLFDKTLLHSLRPNTVLLNAGRGAVIDNTALLDLLTQRNDLQVVLDVWEGEPAINRQLLERVTLATPHIAGYSLDGKLAGTAMIYRACCDFLGLTAESIQGSGEQANAVVLKSTEDKIAATKELVLGSYDVLADDQRLRAYGNADPGAHFDALRKHYPVRREFCHYNLTNKTRLDKAMQQYLTALGF